MQVSFSRHRRLPAQNMNTVIASASCCWKTKLKNWLIALCCHQWWKGGQAEDVPKPWWLESGRTLMEIITWASPARVLFIRHLLWSGNVWERVLNSLDFDLTQYCCLNVIKFGKLVIVHCLFLKSSSVKDLAVYFFHSFPLSFIELPKAQKPGKKVTCFPLQKIRF